MVSRDSTLLLRKIMDNIPKFAFYVRHEDAPDAVDPNKQYDKRIRVYYLQHGKEKSFVMSAHFNGKEKGRRQM